MSRLRSSAANVFSVPWGPSPRTPAAASKKWYADLAWPMAAAILPPPLPGKIREDWATGPDGYWGQSSTGPPYRWHGSSQARTPAASPLALPAQGGEAAFGEAHFGIAQRRVWTRHLPNSKPHSVPRPWRKSISSKPSPASRTDSDPCSNGTAIGHRDRIPRCAGGLKLLAVTFGERSESLSFCVMS